MELLFVLTLGRQKFFITRVSALRRTLGLSTFPGNPLYNLHFEKYLHNFNISPLVP